MMRRNVRRSYCNGVGRYNDQCGGGESTGDEMHAM